MRKKCPHKVCNFVNIVPFDGVKGKKLDLKSVAKVEAELDN